MRPLTPVPSLTIHSFLSHLHQIPMECLVLHLAPELERDVLTLAFKWGTQASERFQCTKLSPEPWRSQRQRGVWEAEAALGARQKQSILTQSLLCARNYSKHLIHLVHTTTQWCQVCYCPFPLYRWGNWGRGRLITLPKVTQLGDGGDGIETQAVWLQSLHLTLR